MTATIALFDIDGVCIFPRGYRAAVNDTLTYFLTRLHLDMLIPDPETPAIYESIGITSEWDMIALTLAIILDEIASNESELFVGVAGLEELKDLGLWGNRIVIDYVKKIQSLAPFLNNEMSPSDSIYRRCIADPSGSVFPNLVKTQVLQDIIGHTRDIRRCATTRHFQNLVLGDQVFEEVYNLPAPFQAQSYLAKYDQIALTVPMRDRLLDLVKEKQINISFITARPSYQPKEIPERILGNTPEGEMGVELLGFTGYPLIGYGRLCYLAEVLDRDVESMLKPSPVQALAAIAAAISLNEWNSLQWAERTVRVDTEMPEVLSDWVNTWLPEHLDVHIFEDSIVGIQAVKNATEFLRQLGKKVDFHAWGISTNPIKIRALEQQGANIVEDINTGIERAFGLL